MQNNLAPICLFVYNRIEETKLTIKALQANFLANESDLIIFSDGCKGKNDADSINKVRSFVRNIKGFKSVKIFESSENKGLAKSVIDGVSLVLEKFETIIVLEDDLVTTPNFLNFMNQSLEFYESDHHVFSTSGYTLNLPSLSKTNKDFYFGYRASSWGWGIWKNRWVRIDWEIKDYKTFIKDKTAINVFRRGGSDMLRMLQNQMSGKIDSWAIRFCYHQFKNDLVTVFPTISKLESIGFSKEATHTSGTKRFITPLDKELKINFLFEKFKTIDKKLTKEFASFFSIKNRIINQINQRFKF